MKLRSSSAHIPERPQKGSHNRQVPALPLFHPPGTLSSPSVIQIKPPPCPGKAFWCYKQEGLTITSQSSPPTHHSHLHFLASLSVTRTRMQPAMPVLLSLAFLSLSHSPHAPVLSQELVWSRCFTQAHKPGHAKLRAPPGPHKWGGSRRVVTHCTALGTPGTLLASYSIFPPSQMHCFHLLVSGLTRSWFGGLITPPSP